METPIIIAEAGINHNGKLSIAKRLADKAKDCGADAVKYQTFEEIHWLDKYELSDNDFYELKDYCDDIGIVFLSTPHTYRAIHFLYDLVPLYKVAGPNLFVGKFLYEISQMDKPLLLSTGNLMSNDGMASIEEITNALKFVNKKQVTLMHCVSKYPCKDPHYERIDILRKEFDLPVGLSDHCKIIKVPKDVAYVEKHFMLDDIKSIDKNVSLNPKQFKSMVKYLRE